MRYSFSGKGERIVGVGFDVKGPILSQVMTVATISDQCAANHPALAARLVVLKPVATCLAPYLYDGRAALVFGDRPGNAIGEQPPADDLVTHGKFSAHRGLRGRYRFPGAGSSGIAGKVKPSNLRATRPTPRTSIRRVRFWGKRGHCE